MKLFLDFAFITGFLLNVLILFLLVKNDIRDFHKKVLSVIFLFILFTLLCFYGYLHKIRLLFYFTFLFEDTISVFIGPLLLLYVKSLFLPTKSLTRKNAIHFVIPFIYLLCIATPWLITIWNKSISIGYITSGQDYFSLIIIYSLVYCFASLRVLRKAEYVIKRHYSNIDGVDLQWIKLLLIGSIIVISIDISSTLYELLFDELEWDTYYLTAIAVVIIIAYLGYHGILQSKILLPAFLLKESFIIVPTDISSKEIKIQSSYDESEMEGLKVMLAEIMSQQSLYLDEDLSLKSLASSLSISDKKLSALLNQFMNVSFYDYVNGLRIDEVKNKIKDPVNNQLTLLGIAFECGFKSKSSFNRIFKKQTGLSPSEYKKESSSAL